MKQQEDILTQFEKKYGDILRESNDKNQKIKRRIKKIKKVEEYLYKKNIIFNNKKI